MNFLQHTRNELNLCLKQNRPDRSYRDTLLSSQPLLFGGHLRESLLPESDILVVPCSQWISQIEKIQLFWTIISRDPDQTNRFCVISMSCFCWSRVFGCSLLFSVQSMAWQATFDVITASAENRREKSPRVSWVCCFWSWNTVQH